MTADDYTPDEFLKMFDKLYGSTGETTPKTTNDDAFDAEVVPSPPTPKKDDTDEKVADLLSDVQKQKKFYEQAEHRKAETEDAKKDVRKKGVHRQLPEVVDMLRTTGIAFLIGAAGTGKSTLAKQACSEIFSLGDTDPITSGKYAQISFSPDTTSGEMIGRSDVNGQFHESEIVRVFRDGGVILFDEIDAADSSMLIKVNTALANGYLATPNGMVVKNPSTYIVCAANTFGTGPDAMYVGRARLDAATLDRFCLCTIYVDYDQDLENRLSADLPEDEQCWLRGYTDQVRSAIRDNKLRRVCSTRFVINAIAHMKNGKTPKWIRDNFLQGWSQAERKKVDAAGTFDVKYFAEKLAEAEMAKKRKDPGSYSPPHGYIPGQDYYSSSYSSGSSSGSSSGYGFF